ncbi:NADH-quinone oxidoreductase subunit K [Halorhodospira sp. 9621]|uniref:NADH-quinone oxidoreductase subunit K n=1 Tax=Halorhodospira TaxID=85108 RepID=UPI001EE83661|nr:MULTISPECIES: NADH-quinone oxidoreductase subunit K [Halorhodospira]MCG5529059.1 NADH-quinone oxidoreductase subunit K [Halorhodospira halophila]MCG5534157.1 NADH-quinone oxidoreductase subunit K [Halorhodospira sp. 9621]MCG5543174.1 NADH-quinone oxidoreductase subunit K [Halorhodospira sp. 9628]
MNHPEIWMLAAAGVFGIGLYSLIVSLHLLRQTMALKVMGSAVFLVLVTSVGEVDGSLDGIAQALVLTGIVIAVAAIAFALALIVALAERTGSVSLEPDDEGGDDGR